MENDSVFGIEPEQLNELLSLGEDEHENSEVQNKPSDDTSKTPLSSTAMDAFAEQPGSWVGSYKLLSVLGEGGMGIVYLAQQEEPIRRQVALKIIKPGMDSKIVIARFEAEKQALALMHHPHIAGVYDAGLTFTGRPYFVMEYVKGIPITEYCDNQKLTIEQRLRLFQEVCQAIQHAHQKGIIHRDIKPSNILVSTEYDNAILKIIDFGVAKAISQPLNERTLLTEERQLLGTPEYMSPEQADMAGEDIDTRSDIYSLGVLLYVLLTGVLPFDSDTLRTGGIEHIRQVIRETDPKTPNTRLTGLGDEARKVAENRRTQVTTLAKKLHKELEWIPLKAMRKERADRYRSASELADDVENYLKGNTLIAGPPSTIYRLKKTIRRNRALITGIAAVIVVSIAGTIVSTAFAIKAERQARTSQEISDFLVNDLLASVQEVGTTKSEVTVESLLNAALKHLEGKFDKEPLIEASIRGIIGDTFHKIGNFEAAQSNMNRAIELTREHLGANDLQTLWFMLAQSWYYIENSKYDEAELILKDTVDGMRRTLSDVDWHLLEAISRLAWVYYNQGRFDEAEKLQAGALDDVRRKLGPEHRYAPNHMEGLAFIYWERGEREKAIELNRKALEISLRDDWNGGEEANITKSLAWMYTESGRYIEAEDLYLNGLELKNRMLRGDENINFLKRIGELATMYRKWKRYDEAEQWLLKAEEIARRVFGDDHKITNASVTNLITLYEAWNKPEKVEEWRVKLTKKGR